MDRSSQDRTGYRPGRGHRRPARPGPGRRARSRPPCRAADHLSGGLRGGERGWRPGRGTGGGGQGRGPGRALGRGVRRRSGPGRMTGPAGDAADRALDDALALANERADAVGARDSAAPDDPLSVAFGSAVDEPGPVRSGSVEAAPGRPGPGRRSAAAGPRDPLAVALGEGEGEDGPWPARSAPSRGSASSSASSPGPSGSPGSSGRYSAPASAAADPRDPLAVALGEGEPAPGRPAPGHRPDRPSAAGRSVGPGDETPALGWVEARRIARLAGRRLAAEVRGLGSGVVGRARPRGLVALTDLPSFDTSAMDGWAVAGSGPWRLTGRRLLAGQGAAEPLLQGCAVGIATGAVLPPGATAVVRGEHGWTERRTDGEWLRVREPRLAPRAGQEMRRRGQECRGGDELLPAGTVVTPAVLGLAAAAGYDELTVTARPRVDVLVLGDELLDHGLPRAGRVRDALGPMLPSWLGALGAEVMSVRWLVDDADALLAAVADSSADLLITTGGTAGGPVDHVHPVLAELGAKLLVDGVAVRPGHPMLLAELPTGRHLVGLPGNPLAAVAGVLTLVAPLLRTLAGRAVPAPYAAPLTADVTGHPVDTRLVPVVFDDESAARPLRFAGPAMLRGLAAADGMAVIPPGGARAGQETAVLDTGMQGPNWGSGG